MNNLLLHSSYFFICKTNAPKKVHLLYYPSNNYLLIPPLKRPKIRSLKTKGLRIGFTYNVLKVHCTPARVLL